jgi:hypothetical protein
MHASNAYQALNFNFYVEYSQIINFVVQQWENPYPHSYTPLPKLTVYFRVM